MSSKNLSRSRPLSFGNTRPASYRAREDERPVEAAQHGPATKDVVLCLLDFLEDAQAALYRGADLEAHPSRQRPRQRLATQDHFSAALDLKGEEGTPCIVCTLLCDVALAYAVARHIVLWKV